MNICRTTGKFGPLSYKTIYGIARSVCEECVGDGGGGTNAGTITVRHTTTTANVFASIFAGNAHSQLDI